MGNACAAVWIGEYYEYVRRRWRLWLWLWRRKEERGRRPKGVKTGHALRRQQKRCQKDDGGGIQK